MLSGCAVRLIPWQSKAFIAPRSALQLTKNTRSPIAALCGVTLDWITPSDFKRSTPDSQQTEAMSDHSTRESTPPRYDNDPDLPRCAFCNIPTVLAASRLHEGWSQCSWSQYSGQQGIQVFEKGASSGCNVCSLVWTSFTACEAASSLGDQVQQLSLIIRRQEERCTFTVILLGRVRYPESLKGTWLDDLRNLPELYPEPSESLHIIDLQVFRGQGTYTEV